MTITFVAAVAGVALGLLISISRSLRRIAKAIEQRNREGRS